MHNLSSRKNIFADQTYLGILAILFWSGTVAFSRNLTSALGIWTTGALIHGSAGLLSCLIAAFTPGKLAGMRRLPRRYLLICGGLFVVYIATLYLAIGLAVNSTQVVVVGLINYLWPGLSLVFSIPLLKKKARPYLLPGILVAFAGVVLSSWQAEMKLADILNAATFLPYLFALIAAVSWGLYTNLCSVWIDEKTQSAVPLFLLGGGLLLGFVRLLTPETAHWSAATGVQLVCMIIFPAMLAYNFWDAGIRRGRMILIVTLSYFTPLISTLITVLLLHIPAQQNLWIGAALVFLGALICRRAVKD